MASATLGRASPSPPASVGALSPSDDARVDQPLEVATGDEAEHVATMAACQDKALTEGTAPRVEAALLAAGVAAALATVAAQRW